MANYKLPDDVIRVLTQSSCNGNALYLPPGQLDRRLYQQVDKALTNAGGKWSKKAQAHLFPTDAGPKLAEMMGTGVAVDEKKRDQAFFSPPEVALAAVRLADVRNRTVLEPQAGNGALVQACKVAGAGHITCVEINPIYETDLKRQADKVTITDFLTYEPAENESYDRVVMNPPFTRNQDVTHVNHALRFLKPDGVLVSVMLDNQDRKPFRELRDHYAPRIVELPHGAFKASGTDVPTVLIRIGRS